MKRNAYSGTKRIFACKGSERKNREFPGPMETMLSGNSLPQICVVSMQDYVQNKALIVINTAQFPDTKDTST